MFLLSSILYNNTNYFVLKCDFIFTDYNEKSPSAVDYSDINELADDVSDLKADLQYNKEMKMEDGTDYDADDEDAGAKSDTQLMPPPPPVPGVVKDENTCEHESAIGESRRRKLDTPLAAMLPSKYQNINVTDIFPDFRVDKVLHYECVVVFYKSAKFVTKAFLGMLLIYVFLSSALPVSCCAKNLCTMWHVSNKKLTCSFFYALLLQEFLQVLCLFVGQQN